MYRVIPRDIFNDANLLKCIGQLCLKIHDGELPELEFTHDGAAFDIQQCPDDGSTFIDNIHFETKAGRMLFLSRPMNARSPWPLYATLLNDDDVTSVFDDKGNITEEFKKILV